MQPRHLIVDPSLTRDELEHLLEEYRQSNEEMRQRAMHDPLTGLPNRMLFEDRAEAAIRRARRAGRPVALAFVDLDGFKRVNDLHGHAAGDELLRATARRLSVALRITDTVARLGGDEFGVLLESLDGPATALALGQKLHRALVEAVPLQSELQGRPVELVPGASIGIALFPDHARDMGELLTRADVTMYEAKRAGGGARVDSLERRQRGETVTPLRERRKGRAPATDQGERSAPPKALR